MKRALAASLLFSLVYGATIVFQSNVIKNSMDPLFLNLVSYCFASILIIAYAFYTKFNFSKISRIGLSWAVLTSIFASILGDSFVMLGFLESSSVNWGILSRLTLPGTFLFGLILLREKGKINHVFSMILALLGALLVVYKPGVAFSLNPGDLYFILAITFYSLANITSQKASLTLSTFELASIRILFATVVFAIIIPFINISHSINWLFSLFNGSMIIFGTFIVTYIIKTAGANFFAITSNLIPVFTAAITFFIFHESLTNGQLIGGLLVIASILLFQSADLFGKRSV